MILVVYKLYHYIVITNMSYMLLLVIIYIYRERERDIHIYIYIYIYIYNNIVVPRDDIIVCA